MKRALISAAALLVLISCGGSGGGGSNPPPAPPPPSAADLLAEDLEGLTLTEFYSESFGALLKRSPEDVVWDALESTFPLDDVALNDLSDEFQRETFAMYRVVLDALRTYDRGALTAAEQLDYDVYEYFLQDVVDQLEWLYYDFRATYMLFSVQRSTERFLADIHPLETRQDAENLIARLNLVDDKFEQLIAHLERQRAAGIVEPRLTLDIALSQVAAIADSAVDDNPYFTNFVAKLPLIPGLTDADRDDLIARARSSCSRCGPMHRRPSVSDNILAAPSTMPTRCVTIRPRT